MDSSLVDVCNYETNSFLCSQMPFQHIYIYIIAQMTTPTSLINLLLLSMVKRAWCMPSEGLCRSDLLAGTMYGLRGIESLASASDSNMEKSVLRTRKEMVMWRGPNSHTWHYRGNFSLCWLKSPLFWGEGPSRKLTSWTNTSLSRCRHP